MTHLIFDTMWGWIGTASIVVLACIAIGYVFPSFRRVAIEIGLVVISAASIYAKGSRDKAAQDKTKSQEAVRKVQDDYAKIDARPDNPGTVTDRLRDGTF